MANFNKNILIVLLVDICLILLIILRPGFKSSNPQLDRIKADHNKINAVKIHNDTFSLLNTGMLSNNK